MKVSIHQPSYWPWLGLLNKIAQSDLFVILDHVDFNKDAYQHRNIFLCNGKSKFITLPVDSSDSKKINELNFQHDHWNGDHLNKLKEYYFRSPFFHDLYSFLESFYLNNSYQKPAEVMIQSMAFTFKYLNIKTEVVLSSHINPQGSRGDMVLDICKKTDAKTYLCGLGAYEYMKSDINQFNQEGIDVIWNNFKHPHYLQNKNHPFIEGLSCLDLFFFHGYGESNGIFWETLKAPVIA